MFRTITRLAWWLWQHRDAAGKISELAKRLYEASDLRAQVDLALQILEVAVVETDTPHDDMVARVLRDLTKSELFDTVLAYVESMILAESQRAFGSVGPDEPTCPEDAGEIVTARMIDVAGVSHGGVYVSQREDEAGNPMVVIGIASLVIQVLRWWRDRRRD